MKAIKLITCRVMQSEADEVMEAARKAGASGITSYSARGSGIREKLGLYGKLCLTEEKEVIIIAAKEKEADKIFDAVVEAGELSKPGMGFAFIQPIERAVGFVK